MAIQKARRYLERSIPKIEKDAYALSLVSYALTLCGSRRAEQVGRKLDALAVETPSKFILIHSTIEYASSRSIKSDHQF